MHPQARDAEWPRRTVAWIAQREEGMVAVNETDMQARPGCVVADAEHARLAQGRSQRIAKTARQAGQGLAGIGIRVLDQQLAEDRLALQRGDDRGDAVARIERAQLGKQTQLLSRENQLPPRQRA